MTAALRLAARASVAPEHGSGQGLIAARLRAVAFEGLAGPAEGVTPGSSAAWTPSDARRHTLEQPIA